MSKELNVYLSGKMSGISLHEANSWRASLKNLLEECADLQGIRVDVFNPCDFYNYECITHQTETEIMQFELNHVRKSDVVIVNLVGINSSIGTIIECYEAMKNEIPVIGYNRANAANIEDIHPWIRQAIVRVETTADSLRDYIRDYYMR